MTVMERLLKPDESLTRKKQRVLGVLGHTIKLTANILINGNANENSPLSYQLTNAINVIIRCSLKVSRMSYLKNENISKATHILQQITNIISNNEVEVMTKEISTNRVITISGVRAYLDENNTAWINLEDAARGLGFIETKKDRVATSGDNYQAVRWSRVREYLRQFNFSAQVGKTDSNAFIP